MTTKNRAPRNRTLTLDDVEVAHYKSRLLSLASPTSTGHVLGRTICQDLFEVIPFLPSAFVDLLIVDPPYNIDKSFNETSFRSRSDADYESWIDSWISPLRRFLKETASIYICTDWRSSSAVQKIMEKYFIIQNRITWEREKGRGAARNWKNCSEDIWFATVSRNYTFNLEAVKVKRRVIAPYTDESGQPKDWEKTKNGRYRITHPSNLWTDISVPFWSMPENTDHPTQKPEKLIAKLILASSQEDDVVLDPFLGSGTTSVVAKKLARRFIGIELDELYCCFAEKRLDLAEVDPSIQGYHDNLFWERNSFSEQKKGLSEKKPFVGENMLLFDPEETS